MRKILAIGILLAVIDLLDISCLYISTPIDEVDAPLLRLGMPARITLDAFPKQHFPGTVTRIAPMSRKRKSRPAPWRWRSP